MATPIWGHGNIHGTNLADIIYGHDDFADSIWGYGDKDVIYGRAGNDTIFGGAGDDSLYGGDNDDQLAGEGDNDKLDGGSGNDKLDGGSGHDRLLGGLGQDTLVGYVGNDYLDGGENDDILWGDTRALYAGETLDPKLGYVDTIYGGAGKDTIYGGPGDDGDVNGDGVIKGDPNRNGITDPGEDGLLSGGNGDDTIYGEAGRDWLDGGGNNDTLIGGLDQDWLDGGPGIDTFRFAWVDSPFAGGKFDTIATFTTEDKIDLPVAGTAANFAHTRLSAPSVSAAGVAQGLLDKPGIAYALVADSQGFSATLFADVVGDGRIDFAVRIDLLSFDPAKSAFWDNII